MKVAARKAIKARKDYHTLIRIVSQNPGLHYRELLRASGLGYGTLERQLALLETRLNKARIGGFHDIILQMFQRKTWNYSTTSNYEHIEKLSDFFCWTMQVAHLDSKKSSCKWLARLLEQYQVN